MWFHVLGVRLLDFTATVKESVLYLYAHAIIRYVSCVTLYNYL